MRRLTEAVDRIACRAMFQRVVVSYAGPWRLRVALMPLDDGDGGVAQHMALSLTLSERGLVRAVVGGFDMGHELDIDDCADFVLRIMAVQLLRCIAACTTLLSQRRVKAWPEASAWSSHDSSMAAIIWPQTLILTAPAHSVGVLAAPDADGGALSLQLRWSASSTLHPWHVLPGRTVRTKVAFLIAQMDAVVPPAWAAS